MIQQKSTIYQLLILALLVIAAWMIYIGASKSMMPPLLSGIGFAIIAIYIFLDKKG